MLSILGLTPTAEAVYRQILQHADWGVADLVAHLGLEEQEVREALETFRVGGLCLIHCDACG
ncbi:hypothetical protein EV385_3178 [Krasilnikovia cinnamomea]|uniref:Uncharacterized protein n=1 Tax=Krasilnikovia cinnamomea TaxID=349313 RepID=A0A4Q7ZKA7_9ACTN|nr:hypothetical protein EV385_3178 [Krasilnikovia cinnamomea]